MSEALVAGVAVRSSRLFAIVMSVPGTKASPSKEKVVPDNKVIPLLPVPEKSLVKAPDIPDRIVKLVIENHGGTCFIPGSHKANYNIRKGPASIDARDSGLWQSYGCPPGSPTPRDRG